MRLTPTETEAIRSSILKLDPVSEIYLYGSRVNDLLKGGDIDLLIISEKLNFSDRLTLTTEILFKIGEQKLDLLITTRSVSASDPFVQSILKSAVRL